MRKPFPALDIIFPSAFIAGAVSMAHIGLDQEINCFFEAVLQCLRVCTFVNLPGIWIQYILCASLSGSCFNKPTLRKDILQKVYDFVQIGFCHTRHEFFYLLQLHCIGIYFAKYCFLCFRKLLEKLIDLSAFPEDVFQNLQITYGLFW